jgi:hypothetical protein
VIPVPVIEGNMDLPQPGVAGSSDQGSTNAGGTCDEGEVFLITGTIETSPYVL